MGRAVPFERHRFSRDIPIFFFVFSFFYIHVAYILVPYTSKKRRVQVDRTALRVSRDAAGYSCPCGDATEKLSARQCHSYGVVVLGAYRACEMEFK